MSTKNFILCIVLISFLFIKTSAYGPLINLTFVNETSAISKQAFCLDGSLPAYHFDKGFEFGVSNWIVFLEGGGWCSTKEECYYRTIYPVRSSSKMVPVKFTGILDTSESNNPIFYNWNKVFVRYCDGSSFMGDVQQIDPVTKLHYRGASIFEVVMEELLAKGMQDASNVILTGCKMPFP